MALATRVRFPTSIGLSVGLLSTVLIASVLAVVFEFFTGALVGEQLLKRAVARGAVPVIGQLFYREGSRANIVVVHVDQRSLSQARIDWPAPYRYHARVLEAIARSEPQSIVVDFMFDANRQDDSLAALEATLCKLSAQGIKLFLAAPSDIDGYRLRIGLDELATKQPPCFEKVSVVQRPDSFDRMAWTYPIQRGAIGDPLPSAALAAYRASKRHELGGDLSRDLALTWGTLPSVRGLNWADDQSIPPGGEERPYCRPWSWSNLLPPILYFGSRVHFTESDSRPVCVFHESVATRELLAPKEENEQRALDDLLRGRIVVYGASFNPGDFVVSPVHEEIPGLYLQAMALDNLLTYDSDWKHEPAEHGLGYWSFLFTGYLLVSFVFVLSTRLLNRLWRTLNQQRIIQRVKHALNDFKDAAGKFMRVVAPRARNTKQVSKDIRKVVVDVPRTVVAKIGIAVLKHAKSFLVFVLLVASIGFLVGVIAHSILNLGVLAYMPVIVFCSLAVVSKMTGLDE